MARLLLPLLVLTSTLRTTLTGLVEITKRSITETHVGWEIEAGESAVIYVQGGPAWVSVDGEGTDREYSGKVGVGMWMLPSNSMSTVKSLLSPLTKSSTPKSWNWEPKLVSPSASDSIK